MASAAGGPAGHRWPRRPRSQLAWPSWLALLGNAPGGRDHRSAWAGLGLPYEVKPSKPLLELSHCGPGKDGGVLALVGRTVRQRLRPAAASHERQKRALVQPSKTDLRDGASATADDKTGIARQGHEQIARVPHATWHDNRGGPVRWRHQIRWNDAQHQATSGDGPLRSNAGCRAAAAADQSDAVLREQRPSLPSKLVCGGSRLGAPEDADLRLSDGG